MVKHPDGNTRTYWATHTRYPYFGGERKDVVEIHMPGGKVGVAELTSFIEIEGLPTRVSASAVLIRWMSKSSRSRETDDYDRPMCEYPLHNNHCLWQWSDTGRDRDSFKVRGFISNTSHMWDHLVVEQRVPCIRGERRARYDVLLYDRIKCHANVARDPSTGHMLQTLQMF